MEPIHPSRESAQPPPTADWFSGPVHIHPLNAGQEATDLEVIAVFFDAGSRTKPHTHSTDQLLYFLEGEGVVADGSRRRRFRPGGIALVPAGEWHWHGATVDRAAAHLSIRPAGPSSWPPDVEMRDWETYMDGVEDA